MLNESVQYQIGNWSVAIDAKAIEAFWSRITVRVGPPDIRFVDSFRVSPSEEEKEKPHLDLVRDVFNLEEYLGVYDSREHLILICPENIPPDLRTDENTLWASVSHTLLHEIIHALLFTKSIAWPLACIHNGGISLCGAFLPWILNPGLPGTKRRILSFIRSMREGPVEILTRPLLWRFENDIATFIKIETNV